MATATEEQRSMLDSKMGDPILVRFDRVYGRLTCYPANGAARVVAQIAGTKTLTPQTLVLVQKLGCEVIVEHQSWALLAEFLK